MTYKFRDMVAIFFVGMIIGVMIIGAVISDANGANNSRDDAVDIAQCIAEFDYTHARGNKFGNLVRGIRWCNVIDRATAHECIAPCVVVLPRNTLEDEFAIDYGWRAKNHPVVRVRAIR